MLGLLSECIFKLLCMHQCFFVKANSYTSFIPFLPQSWHFFHFSLILWLLSLGCFPTSLAFVSHSFSLLPLMCHELCTHP